MSWYGGIADVFFLHLIIFDSEGVFSQPGVALLYAQISVKLNILSSCTLDTCMLYFMQLFTE